MDTQKPITIIIIADLLSDQRAVGRALEAADGLRVVEKFHEQVMHGNLVGVVKVAPPEYDIEAAQHNAEPTFRSSKGGLI